MKSIISLAADGINKCNRNGWLTAFRVVVMLRRRWSFLSYSLVKKRKTSFSPAESRAEHEKALRGRISSASGASGLLSRDPVYHLTNSFIQQFDAVGKERSSKMAQSERQRGSMERNKPSVDAHDIGKSDKPKAENAGGKSRSQMSAEELRKRHDSPVFRHSRSQLENGDFVDRFASYAFNGGTLAASVMCGKGKQMLTACISRALGRNLPHGEKQKKILGENAVQAHADGTQADTMFNRDVNSAVGIVVDTIRGSMTTLDAIKKLANESGAVKDTPLEHRDIGTLSRLFPFMVTKKDKALVDDLRQQIKALEGDSSSQALEKRKTLEDALKKETAVLERKSAEQRKFMTVLNQIQANVADAERIFSADGFAQALAEEIEQLSDDAPPDDGKRRRRTLEDDLLAVTLSEVVSSLVGGAKEKENAASTSERGAEKPKAKKRTSKAGKQTDSQKSD